MIRLQNKVRRTEGEDEPIAARCWGLGVRVGEDGTRGEKPTGAVAAAFAFMAGVAGLDKDEEGGTRQWDAEAYFCKTLPFWALHEDWGLVWLVV